MCDIVDVFKYGSEVGDIQIEIDKAIFQHKNSMALLNFYMTKKAESEDKIISLKSQIDFLNTDINIVSLLEIKKIKADIVGAKAILGLYNIKINNLNKTIKTYEKIIEDLYNKKRKAKNKVIKFEKYEKK